MLSFLKKRIYEVKKKWICQIEVYPFAVEEQSLATENLLELDELITEH